MPHQVYTIGTLEMSGSNTSKAIRAYTTAIDILVDALARTGAQSEKEEYRAQIAAALHERGWAFDAGGNHSAAAEDYRRSLKMDTLKSGNAHCRAVWGLANGARYAADPARAAAARSAVSLAPAGERKAGRG